MTPVRLDISFDPEAIQIIGRAYEEACQSLSASRSRYGSGYLKIVHEMIAKQILADAQNGERDPSTLCKLALGRLGFD